MHVNTHNIHIVFSEKEDVEKILFHRKLFLFHSFILFIFIIHICSH